jgi:hypothetical protein
MNPVIEWRWSKNEAYSRSKRQEPTKTQNKPNSQNNPTDSYLDEKFMKEVEVSAYSSALNHDENTWDILNQNIYNGFSQRNKREELDNKMADREMTQQIGFNPFLGDNYVNDISVSNTFLKPVNTTQEREGEK